MGKEINMGYRLHFARCYKPDWEGGFFNGDYDGWLNLFSDKFIANGWANESEDQFEVWRDDIDDYIESIKDSPQDKNEYFEDYTNEQIVGIMKQCLVSYDEFIRMEWF